MHYLFLVHIDTFLPSGFVHMVLCFAPLWFCSVQWVCRLYILWSFWVWKPNLTYEESPFRAAWDFAVSRVTTRVIGNTAERTASSPALIIYIHTDTCQVCPCPTADSRDKNSSWIWLLSPIWSHKPLLMVLHPLYHYSSFWGTTLNHFCVWTFCVTYCTTTTPGAVIVLL